MRPEIDVRDVDCEIAERMGLWVDRQFRLIQPQTPGFGTMPEVPRYCMDRQATEEVVKFLELQGFRLSVDSQQISSSIKIFTAKFERCGVAHSSDRYERESLAMAALNALSSSIEKIIKQQDATVEE
jgi:hypothetical protein